MKKLNIGLIDCGASLRLAMPAVMRAWAHAGENAGMASLEARSTEELT